MALLLLILVHHLAVQRVYLVVHIHTHRVVFDLLGHIEIDRVIVGREFVSLEKLDGRLVELQNDDLVKQRKAFNIFLVVDDPIGQLCDARYLRIFCPEVGYRKDRGSAFSVVLELDFVCISPAYLFPPTLVHLIFFMDRFEHRSQVEKLKF